MKEKPQELPEGVDQIRAAVHAVDAMSKKVVQAQADYEAALEHLKAVMASGVCNQANGCTHAIPTAKVTTKPSITLDDESVPIMWRIGFMLLADPVLDYQATALRLYGPLDPKTAKNRINGHVQWLRRAGVVESLGSNKFKVNKAVLAKKSGREVMEIRP